MLKILKLYSSSLAVNDGVTKSSYNKMGMMNYSTLINKNSLEYANSKKWMDINNILKTRDSSNISSILCDILFKKLDNCHVSNSDLDYIKDIISEYKINKDDFEKIIKSSAYTTTINLKELNTKINMVYNSKYK